MTLASIPDNLYKLLVLLGVIILTYANFQHGQYDKEYTSKIDRYNSLIDSLNLEIKRDKHHKQSLLEISEYISRKNKVKNPIIDKDSTVWFSRAYQGSKNDIITGDTINKFWNDFIEKGFTIELLNDKLDIEKTKIDKAHSDYDNQIIEFILQLVLGGLIFLIGIIGMLYHQRLQDKLLESQLLEKGRFYSCCQSCGKRFSSICINGRESNGNTNPAFCIDCYNNGTFIEPNLIFSDLLLRAQDHIDTIKKKSQKKAFIEKLRNLDRWKTDQYGE